LLHITEEAMESYAMQTLSGMEIEPLQGHLFACRECRDRLVTVLITAERAASL